MDNRSFEALMLDPDALPEPHVLFEPEMIFVDEGCYPSNSTIPRLQKSKTRLIDEIDLFLVKEHLCLPVNHKGEGWDQERVERIEHRYKMFWKLCLLYPKETLVPTADIDEMWHTHILFTRQYALDCQSVFGYFLHHNPKENTEAGTKQLLHDYQFTKKIFMDEFGENLPEEHNGDCSRHSICT